MRPIELPDLSLEAIEELANLNRTTHSIRLHTHAQMVLLAAEHHMVAADIAKIVCTDEQKVQRWLKRYLAEYLRKNGRGPAEFPPCRTARAARGHGDRNDGRAQAVADLQTVARAQPAAFYRQDPAAGRSACAGARIGAIGALTAEERSGCTRCARDVER